MKLKLLTFILLIGCLTSCEPSRYMTIENHTGSNASILFNFIQDNDYWDRDAGETRIFEFTSTAINAFTELTFGSGSWDEEAINNLTFGINRIIVQTNKSDEVIEDSVEIRNFFEKGIHGKNRNGMRVIIE